MKTIAVCIAKGGAGKSTLSMNLAAIKAKQGNKVLLVDLDPQGSTSLGMGVEPYSDEVFGKTVAEVLLRKVKIADCAVTCDGLDMDNLYLLPANIELARAERDLVIARDGVRRLKKALEDVEDFFDYCIIDCPPQLSVLLDNALIASSDGGVIIPVKTDYFSYRAVDSILQTIKEVEEDSDTTINIIGFVATIMDGRVTEDKLIYDKLCEKYNVIGKIKKNSRVSSAIIENVPIAIKEPSNAASKSFYEIAKNF